MGTGRCAQPCGRHGEPTLLSPPFSPSESDQLPAPGDGTWAVPGISQDKDGGGKEQGSIHLAQARDTGGGG